MLALSAVTFRLRRRRTRLGGPTSSR
ncbi:MAG: hypothetical protein LC642_03445 [Verrucomicrobiaceae bacterium]|nr:hypothetical protein [Verrucomicrobiaceae bacterium]